MKKMIKKFREKWHADIHRRFSISRDTVQMQSLFSYCNNEINKASGNWENSEYYQSLKKIHMLTSVKDILQSDIQMRRVGRNNDGGYIMVFPFSETPVAYSLGIADDVSWDKEMAAKGGV